MREAYAKREKHAKWEKVPQMHFTTLKPILNISIYPWSVRDMKATCLYVNICEFLCTHVWLKSHWQFALDTLFCCWPSSACPFSFGLSSIAFGGCPLTLYCWSCNHTITLGGDSSGSVVAFYILLLFSLEKKETFWYTSMRF